MQTNNENETSKYVNMIWIGIDKTLSKTRIKSLKSIAFSFIMFITSFANT